MSQDSLRFVHRNALVELDNVPPDRTLLELLREDMHCTAVKEGCASGDCGACTVALAEAVDGRLEYRAINSCIRLAHSIDGMAVWTAQDIAAEDGSLHPAQQAMVECHGSQCGFCTPGFVMSLFTLFQQCEAGTPVTRAQAQAAISGNLCRCTGYRPIVDAALTMHHWPAPALDEAGLLHKLQGLNGDTPRSSQYLAPRTMAELLRLRADHPQAQLVAGCTDAGLWITKGHKRYERVIDVTRVAELRRLELSAETLSIGAGATLHDAFAALAAERAQLAHFFERFAGLPVRQSGTLGGNVANGSPIGDSMPLLIALGAEVVLASARGERVLPIEDFYLAYRKTALAPDEVLARIIVPRPQPQEMLRAYKISKRFEDDISAVCLCVAIHAQDGVIQGVRVGAGGVAAVPARACKTEAALMGQPFNATVLEAAAQVLRAEFEPISDMRASSAYRREVLGNLLLRFFEETQPGAPVPLADLTLEDLA
ncbi:MAG: xanthine dehydrogenase small subunit [Ottowia sp.]|uniref:xanthine dehydrogenase small subunit n=1 Tax=Ottowia sp. TaxID=1898956 RepID=UPI003C77C3A9